jgi:hypothetical protein
MAWNEEVGFGLTGLSLKGESQFWPEFNGLDWQMSVLADCFP